MRSRLQHAALDLYRDRGFDRTTTAEIAAQAGVTERTFFRHFADKREVLFDGEAEFKDALADAVAQAPDRLGPMDVLRRAFRSVEPMLEANRPFAEPRHAVIAATPALQERAEAKTAAVIAALAAALRQRGVEPTRASLVARIGMAALGHAAGAWFTDPSPGLGTHLERAFEALNDLTVADSPRPR